MNANDYFGSILLFLMALLLFNICGCTNQEPKFIGKTIHKNIPSTIPHQEFRCIPGRSGYGVISAKEIDAALAEKNSH